MTYSPQTWQDEVLAGEENYTIKTSAGAVLFDDVKIELKTPVVQVGSDVSAERMTHIEQGIVDAAPMVAASSEEVSAGTENNKAVTPGSLALSDYGKRIAIIPVIGNDEDLITGDGKRIITIPQEIDGWRLVAAHAGNYTPYSGGTVTVQIRNVTDSVDMLTTRITIEANEYSSYTAATPPVINTANSLVSSGDRIAVDVDVAGGKGLDVILTFQRVAS